MSVARATRRRSSRLTAVTVATLLTLTACGDSTDDEPAPTPSTTSASTASSSPTPTSEPTASLPAIAELTVAPGRIGPVRAGMTRDEALATGLFDEDVPVRGEDCGRDTPLGWKPAYASSLDVQTTDDGTIVSLGVRGDQPRTADGLGVGSTLREVSGAYETAEMTEAGYGQTGVFVTDGDDWLGFLFDEDTEAVGPTSTVTMVEVTSGTRPTLTRDGC